MMADPQITVASFSDEVTLCNCAYDMICLSFINTAR